MVRLAAWCIAAGLVLCACSTGSRSTDDEGPASTRADSAPTTVPVIAAAGAELERYVEAINRGDVATAMRLRCAGARVDDGQLEAFERDAAALIAATGPLRITAVEPAADLAPVDGLLRYSFEGHDGALTIAGGEDGWCFWRPAASFELQRRITAPIDLGEAAVPPEELLPVSVGDGYSLAPTPRDGDPPTVDEISRSWQASSFGGVTVNVATHPDAGAALEEAARLMDRAVADGVAAVEIETAPDVRAVRSLGYAWLWVQPPSSGPYIDLSVVPFGRVLVTVRVSGLEADTVDEQLRTITTEIVERARPGS